MKLFQRDARRRLGLAALVVAALGLRVAAVVVLAAPANRPVTFEHGAIAENLLAGRGFSIGFLGGEGPTSQQAPWVPLLLAACYAVLGVGSKSAIIAYQLLQCLAGTALVVAIAKTAWNGFPERRGIGWTVGWLAALYPPHLYMATHVQAAVWGALGVAMLFLLVSDERRLHSPRTAVLVGLVGGWLLLVDPILALVLPIVVFQLCIGMPPKTRDILFRPALTLGCMLVVVGPWLVRNYVVHGEFVFVKSTFGYAFWQGNNPQSWGTDKIPKPSAAALADDHDGTLADRGRGLWEARHETLYIDDVLLKPTGYQEFAGLSEPARSRLLGRRGWSFVVERPGDYLRLCLQRFRYFWLWDETNPKARHVVYQASSVVWLMFSLIGLLAARQHWRRLAPTMLAVGGVALFHTLTITSARFRVPLEPLAMTWGAVGFYEPAAHLAARLRKALQSQSPPPAPPPPMLGRHKLHGPHVRPASVASRSILRRR